MEDHKEISHFEADDASGISEVVNSQRFHNLSEIGEHTVEIEKIRTVTRLNVPVQIGFFVLEYGKLRLLSFYYDFIVKYLEPDSYCLIEADTDSLYMGLSEQSIHLAVREAIIPEYCNDYENWVAREYCDDHKVDFFETVFSGGEWKPNECCKKVAKFYQRSGGLFHIENISKGVIALCSKSYYCFGDVPKYSAKGVNRRQNDLTEEVYKHVLFKQEIKMCTNKGFQRKNEGVYTYVQTKKGLNYFYGKRIVCPDHVTTLPTPL